MNPAVERDLARAREELAKLGKKLPGDDSAEIARYVAERKRNWPRRRIRGSSSTPRPDEGSNISTTAGRNSTADAVSLLVSGYDGMGDDESGSEGEIREGVINDNTTCAKEDKGERGKSGAHILLPNTPNTRPQRVSNGGVFKNRDRKRNTLLGAILKKSIERERFVLLEAFKHLIR